MNITKVNTVIIGAGLTGLFLGKLLKDKGQEVLILEKSRGLGGRVATRRIDQLGLDHGAAFLTATDQLVEILIKSKLHYEILTEGILVKGGMNQLAKFIAQGQNILKEQRLEKIEKIKTGWLLESDNALTIECKNLIITAPVPQALELLNQNCLLNQIEPKIETLKYSKALIFLGVMKNASNIANFKFMGHQFLPMNIRDLHPNGLIIQLANEFSEKWFNESDEIILEAILKIFKLSPMGALELDKYELKKWRYSKIETPLEIPFYKVQSNLILCGDSFIDPLASAEAVSLIL